MLKTTFQIHPYRDGGDWFFDDLKVGLLREPLTDGVPELLEVFNDHFVINFSDTNYGNPTYTLVRDCYDRGSTIYRLNGLEFRCWLCSALLRYFAVSPEFLYIWISVAN